MDHSQNNNNPYAGKIAVVYGDSITHGTFTDVGQSSPDAVVKTRWCDIVAERLGFASLTNYAQNGISISSTSSVLSERALSKCYNEMRDDAEIVLIAGGCNDFGTNVVLGNSADEEDVSFCGGLHILCKGLQAKYPHAAIIFITPIDRKGSASNDLGLSLDEYRNKIKEIAGDIYGFHIVDGECTGFDANDPTFLEKYMLDGTHPNQECHLLYGEAVVRVLLSDWKG